MKENEAKLLIQTGAVDRATIMFRAGEHAGHWEVWMYGDELPSHVGNPIKTARGHYRTWASLDSAHKWITEVSGGRKVAIEIK